MAAPQLSEITFTHSGDKTTFYWSAGPRDGPLLIFIHGWPANGETWKPQLLALAALGFRTVAPDCRGYGRSSVPTSTRDYALEHHSADMLALLHHLGRTRAVWIGHDLGAGLVWAFATHHPDACAGAACLTVPYGCLEHGVRWLAALANRDIYPEAECPLAQWDYQAYHAEQPEESARLLEANIANTVKQLFPPGNPAVYGKPAFTTWLRKNGGWWGGEQEAPDTPLEQTLLKHDKALYERIVAELERNGFGSPNAYYLNYDVNEEYAKSAPNGGVLRFPTLFIEARWDTICDTALSRLSEPMREMCTDLTECSIEAGHWVAMEKPEETNAAIVRWIATKLPTYFPGYWKTPFVSRA